jgi:hypothetical protein
MASMSWLAITAATETGTNRTNCLPVLLRSHSRSGPGTVFHAALAILGAASVMYVLGCRRSSGQ